jgi:transcriptional regulator with XRE-family HTH domain
MEYTRDSVRGEFLRAAEVEGKSAAAAEVEVRRYAGLLRQAIRAAGLSIAEVERRLGVRPKSLRRVLSGEDDLMFKHVVLVLRVIGMSHEEFFTIALRRKALTPRLEASLESLRGEFDALVERMQTDGAKAAGRALFAASPRRLGNTARAAIQRRAAGPVVAGG